MFRTTLYYVVTGHGRTRNFLQLAKEKQKKNCRLWFTVFGRNTTRPESVRKSQKASGTRGRDEERERERKREYEKEKEGEGEREGLLPKDRNSLSF